MIPYSYYAVLSSILFSIALFGVITRRNGITLIVSGEIIINAAMINFVAGSGGSGGMNGVSYALLILIIAVFETVAVISMLIALSRRTNSTSLQKLKSTRG
ncbi:MAG: NADH-quinone oxidoreductase subunit NuoK [Candidatus Parvarchaeota archaeon]|nr:NADH-quinone oxidoreductase subunit NuoK [Candidatus Parvarchaeota archaeon]